MMKKKGKKAPKKHTLLRMDDMVEADGNVKDLTSELGELHVSAQNMAGTADPSSLYDVNSLIGESSSGMPNNILKTRSEPLSNQVRRIPPVSPLKSKAPVKLKAEAEPDVLLRRADIFGENFGKADAFMSDVLKKITKITSQIDGAGKANVSIEMTGTEHVNDLFLYLLYTVKDKKPYTNVKSLDITGCLNVTDVGITYVTKMFPNLTKINLSGCQMVSEAGLYQLVTRCNDLKDIEICGTIVAILPRKVADLNITTEGYPCISPEQELIEKQGLKIMKASLYVKPADKDLVKVCMINKSDSCISLAKYITSANDKTIQPIVTKNQFKLTDRFMTNFVECDEVLSDLLITKRALYVLTISPQENVKVASKRLYSLVSHILSKVHKAAFLFVCVKSGNDKYDLEAVQTSVSASVAAKSASLGKLLTAEQLELLTGKDTSPEDQKMYMRRVLLWKAFKYFSVDSIEVDTSTEYKAGDSLCKKLETGLEMTCTLYPEFQELAGPLFKFVQSDTGSRMLKDGIVSLSSAKPSNCKIMELLETIGRAVCINVIQEARTVCSVDWLARVVNQAFSCPRIMLNGERIIGAPPDTPMWTLEDLKNELEKTLPAEQAASGAMLLVRSGVSVSLSVFISYKHLPLASQLDVEEFFPEIPPTEKRKDLFYTAGYKAQLVTSMAYLVVHRMQFLFSRLKKPTAIWQNGFVIMDGCVETLVLLDPEDNMTLSLYTHTVKTYKGDVEQSALEELVWNTLLQYRIIFDYVLQEMNVCYELFLVAGEKPKNVYGLVAGHSLQHVVDELGKSICAFCNSPPKQFALLWDLHDSFDKKFMSETMFHFVDNDAKNIKVTGNVLKFKGEAQVAVKTAVSAGYQSKVKVTLLNQDVTNLQIGLGVGHNRTKGTFRSGIVYDLGSGRIWRLPSDSTEILATITKDKRPAIGDTIMLSVEESEKVAKHVDVVLSRDSEILFKVTTISTDFIPFIRSKKSDTGYKAAVAIHPVYDMSATHSKDVRTGMRLEALDRKNPHLICVATVAEIYDNGDLLIHFDGWTSQYDYRTNPTSNDLHPVGWMHHNMKEHKLRQELQIPNRYGKIFTWESYCEENEFEPVPFDWFTEEQIGKTSMDKYLSILSHMSILSASAGDFYTSCPRQQNVPRKLEMKVLRKVMNNTKDMFDFFTKHNKFFCILPSTLNMGLFRNPSLQSIMNFSKQNIHILCPGIKTELLHFVDYKGIAVPSNLNIAEAAPYLQNCCMGLLIQEEVLPKNCSKLIPGIEERSQFEVLMQRLLYSYVVVLELFTSSSKSGSNRVALDLFGAAAKDKDAVALFSEMDPSPRCKGHGGSSMANHELREIPLAQYSQFHHFMTKLDFQNNLLETLPQDLFTQFQVLEVLNLANNRLDRIPEGMNNLKELQYFDISGNKISKLPSDFDSLKDTLISLNISNNPFQGMPTDVFELENLEELLAENVGIIKDLSKIVGLKKLEVLNLAKNSISAFPDGLGDLPLISLDLSGVPWFPSSGQFQSFRAFMQALRVNNVTAEMTEKEMHELFVKCDADESSSLTPNELLELNYSILLPKYPRLGRDKLSYEKTGGVPPFVFRLTNLKKLVLRHHALVTIPDQIKSLTELTELDLSYNPKLVTLSAELGACPIKHFQLQECVVLNTPPKEIVVRGVVSIMGYLKRLKLGASPCKRTKLMMVGLGGAGKTSLVESLMNDRYRAYMDHDEPITDGIDITKWEIVVDKNTNDKLTFSVWDFAGQTVYYNTHQFFLSNRAVYLLLWNVRQGHEHAGLDFWLSSIACHAPKAPILLIGTHVDKVEKFTLPEESLKSRYPQISAFHYVSSYTGLRIPELRKSLIKLTLEQKYMGERIPEAWLTLEKRLISYREEKGIDILPYRNLDAFCGSCGIFDRAELVQAIQFLHDLGAVQFFNKDFLRDMVVIYPQWIVDVMACLVTVHIGAVKNGRLQLKDVGTVWKDYPTDLHPWLLRLTEEFDLTCPLPDEDVSIVPCLLPDEEPEYDWPHAKPEKNIHESMTVYRFQYLPAGLFNRAQVRLHQYSKGSKLWKKGSYMNKNGHICLMLQTDNQEVIVRAQGFRPDNFLFLVHEMIETLIIESYSGVQYDFLLPCMDCLSMNVKDPSMVSHAKVQRALELNVPFLQCEKFFHILSIQELRDAMPSDKMSDMDNHLRNSVRELIDLTQEATINVFFVFSSKNQPSLSSADDLVYPGTVLEDLRKQGNFKVSYTDKPESSDMEALSLSMKSAAVTIIGMSDEFCADPECKKLVLYAKDVLRRPVLLLLLGKTKNWQKSDINLSIGTEVYVDMTNKERYPHKIKELYEALKKKAAVKNKIKDENIPKVFVSYCWTNSHDAITKGSRPQEGSLGWDGGDPRKVKVFLEEKGIKCWLDVERVGGVGLFHSIADGLKEAEVFVAFVSDEYVKSRNCVMEFRYALSTLRIPVIIVVVGTGYEWERSEVGLLSVGHKCPKVNLQYEHQTGYLEVLKMVQDKITQEEGSHDNKESAENQRNIAFQEVLELTQRKFLRHMYTSIISQSEEPYPSLIVVDFLTEAEKNELNKKNQGPEKMEQKGEEKGLDSIKEGQQKVDDDEKRSEASSAITEGTQEDQIEYKSKYCFRVLCENPEGWHMTEAFVPFAPELDPADEQNLIDNAAPYLGRVYAIARHSNIQLECLATPEGEIFQQRIEEIGMKNPSDFKEEYSELRTVVIQQDKGQVKKSLNRCQVNGKMVWLCQTHKQASRSKTEMRYQEHLEPSIPLPADVEQSLITPPPPETEAKGSTTQTTARSQRKVFKRTSDSKPNLKRQTSQACSVM